MPQEETPATQEPSQDTPATAPSIEESFATALQQHAPEESPEQASQAKEPVESAPQGQAVEEPEHVKWLKSVQGNVDPASGQILIDRVAKQAYELNRQNQTTAQTVAQLNRILQHPEIDAVIQRLAAGVAAQPKPEQEDERTPEQIIEEHVAKIVESKLGNVQPVVNLLHERFLASEIDLAYRRLQDEFGKEGEAFVYDSIRDQVGQQFATVAQQMGVPVDRLIAELADRGSLFDSLASVARNILFPKLRATTAETQQKQIEDKKRTRLTPKGTPATQVKTDTAVKDFWDAARLAEQQTSQQ